MISRTVQEAITETAKDVSEVNSRIDNLVLHNEGVAIETILSPEVVPTTDSFSKETSITYMWDNINANELLAKFTGHGICVVSCEYRLIYAIGGNNGVWWKSGDVHVEINEVPSDSGTKIGSINAWLILDPEDVDGVTGAVFRLTTQYRN